MCGIAASFAYSSGASDVNSEELRAMLHRMASRGPDGSGLWTSPDSRVALAHCRLSILDLSSNGNQPMVGAQGETVIVFNGEIYNFQALRSSLEAKGYSFRSNCDTEVLLHLYAEKGRAMVEDLRGMFAFAIWDARQQGLFLARDPYGIKPLYYADDGATLRVASQVKALLTSRSVDTSPEPAGHAGFFLWGYVPEPFTLYKSIRALPAGSTLWLDQRGHREFHSFAGVTNSLMQGEKNTGRICPKEQDEIIGSAIRDSIKHHLVSDVPVGLFLSSGLDSISLLALAAEQGAQLRTITLGFEEFRGTINDETPMAEQVARTFGAQHQTVWISRQEFASHYERLINAMDQPSVDGVNTYFVSYAAAQTSLKVAISGLGGDELFGGYPSFTDIPRLTKALKPFRRLGFVGAAFRSLVAPVARRLTSPKYASILEYGGSWEGAYLLRRGLMMPWELEQVLDRDFAREGLDRLATRSELTRSLAGLTSAHRRVSALESTWYMRNQLLRDSDWASMAHSLELRVPLVDWTLLGKLAPFMTGEGTFSKRTMISTLKTPLPDSVLNRPKTGFSIPVRQWMRHESHVKAPERGLRGWAGTVYSRLSSRLDSVQSQTGVDGYPFPAGV